MENELLGALAKAESILDGVRGALVASFGPAAPAYAAVVLGALLVLLALPTVLRRARDPLDRFLERDGRDIELLRLRGVPEHGPLQGLAPLLEPASKDELDATRRELRAAGYKDPSAFRIYYAARAGLGVALLATGLLFLFVLPEDPKLVPALAVSGALGVAGYAFPYYWIKRRIAMRRQAIQNDFPDAMDMMLVCIEGGHSLDQAIARVAAETKPTGSPLPRSSRSSRTSSAPARSAARCCATSPIAAPSATSSASPRC